MTWSIRVEGLDPILARLREAPQIIEAELSAAMHDGTQLIETDAHGRVKVDTRALQSGITSEITPLGAGGVRGVVGVLRGPATKYARPVEEGRRAGARPPPTAPIAAWLRRHGADPRLAFVVARAIGKRGIPKAPFMKPAFEAQRAKVLERFRMARDKIVARLAGR